MRFWIGLAVGFMAVTVFAAEVQRSVSEAMINAVAASPHPRLMPKDGPALIRTNAVDTPAGRLLAPGIIRRANCFVNTPVAKRVPKWGGRLLHFSREVLGRITALATAYYITGNEDYARQAVKETLAACRYSEWQLRFFLDTAEMALACSIAYDWLYDFFTPDERRLVAETILERALRRSFRERQWWASGTTNICQVCHSSLTAAAIAVADYDPRLARDTINRAIKNLPRVMKHSYSPSGAYPEGPGYWSYGTMFNCVFFAVTDAAFGTNFGLDRIPGVDKTIDFIEAGTGNVGLVFSYSDCGIRGFVDFARYYLIEKYKRYDSYNAQIVNLTKSPRAERDRLLPLAMLYVKNFPEPAATAAPKAYFSGENATNPIVILRSGFGTDDFYLGVKGGSPGASHGHMDAGSYVLENGGVRWIHDLGASDYVKMEKAGIDRHNRQDSNAWTVFHVGPGSHGILRIDDALQLVKGRGEITSFSDREVVMELSSLYTGQLESYTRTWQVGPDRGLVVTDQLSGVKPGASVGVQFCTPAKVAAIDGNRVTLTAKGRTMTVSAAGSSPSGTWRSRPAHEMALPCEPPYREYTMVYYEVKAPENGRLTLINKFDLAASSGK